MRLGADVQKKTLRSGHAEGMWAEVTLKYYEIMYTISSVRPLCWSGACRATGYPVWYGHVKKINNAATRGNC